MIAKTLRKDQTKAADPPTLAQMAALLCPAEQVVELRILHAPRAGTVSGYFRDPAAFVQAAQGWSGKAPGVYATLNPCQPDLLARADHHLKAHVRTTTADHEIVARRWLPLDFDPVRPAGISSTDPEHEAALLRAEACTDWLTAQGWPAPVQADSGNGAHRLYRIALPNDVPSRTLLERCLHALALYFSDETVALDTSVGNAARIWKVYGTLACKGDSTPTRPHRLARLLDVPSPLDVVAPALLEALAARFPEAPPRQRTGGAPSHEPLDLDRWLPDHGLTVVSSGAWHGKGTRWVLNPCPWNSAHTNNSAFVLQFTSGGRAAGCRHHGCQGNDWHALRELVDPGGNTAHAVQHARAARNGHHGAVPSTDAWTATLATHPRGDVKETFNNLALAVEHLPPWSTGCWYDLVRDRAMVDTAPLGTEDRDRAARTIEQVTGMPIRNLKLVDTALRAHCHQRKRDPLQEQLAALAPWDTVKRLTEWLADHAGVPKTAYTMAVARLLPVSMVARALQPGIQCRSVVILEGAQDIGKSQLVKLLAGEEWYREVSGTLEGKEAHMLIKGAWVVELSEMDILLRTEESRVKSFITMCNDEYVPKYANDPVKLARRTILVGTINPEGDGSYLRDQTGSTRYYPVPVGTIALDDIAACRDQLLAEALDWFRQHPTDWWRMPLDATDELALTREARRKETAYEGPRLQEWLTKVRNGGAAVDAPFHTEDALRYCFNIPPERWSASTKDQVGKAIKKFGWTNKPERVDGRLQRLWRPEDVTRDAKV
jgi:hypothetical protein